ncbi:HAMP domain-containing sensor histidine kinase [Bdellovibrio sp. ArHS]|uniref:sensor histidine kinase n=1 Tax=Bdellovibrio sp. ArHS TaxID=1569284 RepID=UPI0025C59CA6|nr:HAMP domain-containing sensor histidine kinase [Bdellovibrio sp. ArHS]
MKLLIKVFLTFLLTAIFIVGGLALLGHSLSPEKSLSPVIESNAVYYLQSLSDKIKTAADIEALREDLHLRVRREGFEDVADRQGLPSFAVTEKKDKDFSNKLSLGRVNGFYFAEVKGVSPRTVWFIANADMPRAWVFPFLWAAAFIFFIMAMSFLTIRWMMSPIKAVVEGVNKISQGNLKYRIQTRHRGEFGVIADSFNNMADGLEKMIVAKEQLLRDVSHELRSPLTRVGVAVDLLADEKMKVSIKEDLAKMEDLIHQILESYRLKEGAKSLKKANTNLSELIASVAADYESLVQMKLQLPSEASLPLDGMQMQRVLRNLVENAIKYVKPGTRGSLEILLNKDCDFWVLKLKDDGIGISEKDLTHIFEPFYRADPARSPGASGFGLGLAIARAVVEAHGGTISVRSQIDVGSEFTIRLPIK